VLQVRPNDSVQWRKLTIQEAYAACLTTDKLVEAVCAIARGAATEAGAAAELAAFSAPQVRALCLCGVRPAARRCCAATPRPLGCRTAALASPCLKAAPSSPQPPPAPGVQIATPDTKPLLKRVEPSAHHPGAEYRLAGDRYIQIECAA
jgi:hypothetical protein